MSKCITDHNSRTRYTDGFWCEDCKEWFSKSSPTYRSGELLSSIWMVLNNINAQRFRDGEEEDAEIAALKKEIGIGLEHDNYEDIISRAEPLMTKYSKEANSASISLE